MTDAARSEPRSGADDGVARRVAEKRREVEAHLARDDFDAALPMLKKLAALPHESTRETAAWAKRELQRVARRASQSQEQTAAVCRLARQLLEQHDYTGAVRILADVREHEASDESRELLEEARSIVSEIATLGGEIEAAMDTKRYDDARPLVARFLELKPRDRGVREIASRLKSYGGRGSGAGLARERGYGSGEGFGMGAAVWMTLIVAATAFGGGLLLIRSYLKSGGQTVAVAFDSSVPVQEFSVVVGSDVQRAVASTAGLKLKPGRHTVRLLRNQQVVAATEIDVGEKGANPSLRVEPRGAGFALVVMPAGTSPAGDPPQAIAAAPSASPANATPAAAGTTTTAPAAPASTPSPIAGVETASGGNQAEALRKLFTKWDTGLDVAVRILTGDNSTVRSIQKLDDIPSEPFKCITVVLMRSPRRPFGVDDVALLRELPLEILRLSGEGWTGEELSPLTGNRTIKLVEVVGERTLPVRTLRPFRGAAALASFGSLTNLTISFLSLTDGDLDQLTRLPSLDSATLTADRLTPNGLTSLRRATALRNLELYWHETDAKGPKDEDLTFLGAMPVLDRLAIEPCQELNGSLFSSPGSLPGLRSITLVHAARFDDAAFGAMVKAAPNLRMIRIGKPLRPINDQPVVASALSGKAASFLKDHPTLESLTITGAPQFGGDELAALATVPQLGDLDLSDTSVADADFRHVAACPGIKLLRIEGLALGETACEHLSKMTSVRNLFVGRSGITDAGLEKLKGMSSLQRLNCFRTKVTKAGVDRLKQSIPNLSVQFP